MRRPTTDAILLLIGGLLTGAATWAATQVNDIPGMKKDIAVLQDSGRDRETRLRVLEAHDARRDGADEVRSDENRRNLSPNFQKQ